jgi:glyoxylase-like metal-dependent hydrolase (beta-lactamase superfamily II)
MTASGAFPQSRYFTLERLADGAYAAIATAGQGAMGNAGIVDLGDSTLVFDTMLSLAAARDLRSAAEQFTGQRVRYVVNSHHHIDHTQGNQIFDDATIIGTPRVADHITEATDPLLELMREQGMALDAQARAEAAAVSDPAIRQDMLEQDDDFLALLKEAHEARSRLPDVRFESRLTLHGATRHVELITWGGGHTPSDVVLYLPQARVLYSGDLISHETHPSISTGDPFEWLRILGEMEQLDFETLAPGHGPVTNRPAIAAERSYLETVLELARAALAEDKSADEAAATPIPSAYLDWGFPSGFQHTMRAVYTFLRDHKGGESA